MTYAVTTFSKPRRPRKESPYIGECFGWLLVVKIGLWSKKNGRQVRVECRCGNKRTVRERALLRYEHVSCGCYSRQGFVSRNTKHGKSRTREAQIWADMRQRCQNPNSRSYARYGGRGIKVCERWNEFANFLADMGPRPSSEYSLDRKNNDGDYTPNNCRWALRTVQANNTRTSRFYTYEGQRLTIAQWARRYGVTWMVMKRRLEQTGRPTECAAEVQRENPRFEEFHVIL